MRKFMKLAGVPLLALVAACSSPEYYLLPPPTEAPTKLASPVRTISVSEISLPSYAEAIEMAVVTDQGAVELDSSASWADTPRRGLTRHLVAALGTRLTAQVGAEPWPGLDRPGLQVSVLTDRLIGNESGSLEFSGQYIVTDPESGRIFASERFDIRTAVPVSGFEGIAAAHARAVELLADDIAARISGSPRPAA